MSNLYTSLVSSAKLAARDILRMQKISKHLARESAVKSEHDQTMEMFENEIKRLSKRLAIAEFEANAMPEAHPAKEDHMKAAAELHESITARIESLNEKVEALTKTHNEKLEEIAKAITEWSDGTRKVSKDDLEALTNDLLKKNVEAKFEKVVAQEKTA